MSLSRVHPSEWLTCLLGLAILAGLLSPWNGDTTALSSLGLLGIVLLLAATAAIVLPLIVARSSRTDVPIVYETTLWTASLLLSIVLVIRLVAVSDSGSASGYWLVFTGMVAMGFVLWRSIARQS